MPRTERFSDKARQSLLGKAINSVVENTVDLLNALDFIESPQGLNVELFPVQRILTKAMFGVPMDYREGRVPVKDAFGEKLLYTFTDREYLDYVYNEGRCNFGDWQDLPTDGFREICVFAGRRGGKSQLVSGLGAYALYKLLNIRSPQEYFGLVSGSPIDFTFMAQDDEGSSRLYDKLREDVNRAPFFTPYLRVNGASEMSFITGADREKRDATPTIKVASYPCTTNAVRGPSSYFLALDEFAFYRSARGSSSDEIYDAATPATMFFRKNKTGPRESMILSISSPNKKVGKMYDVHKQAMEKGKNSPCFTLRLSSAEMNPYSDPQFLRERFDASPMTWKAEYGGQFLESSESFVKESQIIECTDKDRPNSIGFEIQNIGRQYFWFIDLGMIHDATALAIGHLEYVSPTRGVELVYDYIDRMMVGERFDGPGVENLPGENKYVKHQTLDLTDIIKWFSYMNRIFPCYRGGTDQHGGQQLVQLLEIQRIHNVELINLSPTVNSQMYFALKGFIERGRCRFPNNPKFQAELKNIEAEFVNKYQIRVQAPAEKGAHDDMCDVAAGVAMLAHNWLNNEKHLLLDPTGSSLARQDLIGKPLAPLGSVEGLSMTDLKVLNRQQKLQKQFGMGGGAGVQNPFHKRGRRR